MRFFCFFRIILLLSHTDCLPVFICQLITREFHNIPLQVSMPLIDDKCLELSCPWKIAFRLGFADAISPRTDTRAGANAACVTRARLPLDLLARGPWSRREMHYSRCAGAPPITDTLRNDTFHALQGVECLIRDSPTDLLHLYLSITPGVTAGALPIRSSTGTTSRFTRYVFRLSPSRPGDTIPIGVSIC